MVSLRLDSKLVRAMSILGGRNLVKTGQTLVGNIAKLNNAKSVSDGASIQLIFKNAKVNITFELDDPSFNGTYYTFQSGTVVFKGEQKYVERVKATLFEIAAVRKRYLERYTTEDLERYSLDKNFVNKLSSTVESLKISA